MSPFRQHVPLPARALQITQGEAKRARAMMASLETLGVLAVMGAAYLLEVLGRGIVTGNRAELWPALPSLALAVVVLGSLRAYRRAAGLLAAWERQEAKS